MIKLPEQFRDLFANKPQLSEDLGEKLARWAAGANGSAPAVNPPELLARFEACSDPATLRSLEEERRACWSVCSKDMKEKLKAASEGAAKRIADASRGSEEEPPASTPEEDAEFEAGFGKVEPPKE